MEADIKLNEQQRQAVTTKGKHVLVLAGPGAGKTRVLVERVVNLMFKSNCSGYDILMLTFTRKAAKEMKERITARVGQTLARKITIGTFHSVCLRILKECGSQLGYQPDTLSVYDERDQEDILLDIIETNQTKINSKILTALINEFRIKGPNIVDIYRELYPNECRVFAEYRSRLKENNAVDYGLLLTEVQQLFLHHPDIISHYHNKWKHVLVDEYQDTDYMQYNLHTLMNPDNLFCVGDSDQAIYSFRGATIEVILNFRTDYFDSEIIELSGSYRCAKSIVTTANNLIRHNSQRYEKSIFAYRKSDGEVNVSSYPTQEAEATAVVRHIMNRVEQQQPLSDIVVLSRTRKPLQIIASDLELMQIPHVVVGMRNDFLNEPQVKAFHAFLSLIVNPRDNLAFCRLRHFLRVDNLAYAKIRLEATRDEISHFHAYLRDSGEWWPENIIQGCGFNLLLWKVCIYRQWGFESIKDDLDHLILQYTEENACNIQEYLEWIQQRDIQDEVEEETDMVRLMTIHAVKGLEFNHVVIIDMNEGHLPHSRAKTAEAIEEERRLCYVAITRAKAQISITRSINKVAFGQRLLPAEASRFLREI